MLSLISAKLSQIKKDSGQYCPKPHFLFLLSTIFYFLFFHTQHNIISKIQQNKTTDTYSTSQGPIKREGRGKDNKNTKVTPLYNHVCPTKNTAKHQWLKAWPHQLAPLYIRMTLFAGGYRSNMFFYTCVV